MGMLAALSLTLLGAVSGDTGYVNTWLTLGPFENGADNAGFARDWIGETAAAPKPGDKAAGQAWRWFDDRLFSRNLDDYQDLFSYCKTKRGESAAGCVVYAHVWVFSPGGGDAVLQAGAHNECRAWLNGTPVLTAETPLAFRDFAHAGVTLQAGWNRLLIKVGNQGPGRFGFQAGLVDSTGKPLPDLVYSPVGGAGALTVATRPMEDADTGILPAAYREWPYVGADAAAFLQREQEENAWLHRPDIALCAADFRVTAGGGTPPYRWKVVKGELPDGLELHADGRISGTVTASAKEELRRFEVEVRDAADHTVCKSMEITVAERPNKWYEDARLVALIHGPESMADMKPEEFDQFAGLMKQQGYGLGMVISYNNGEHKYRYKSLYDADNKYDDLILHLKESLEKAGMKFGMYFGNFDGDNHGGDNGAVLVIEEAVRRFHPAALWLDWAGWDCPYADAFYSAVKSIDPATVIVVNGVPTVSNGDWDVACLEGWNCWGKNLWNLWPFELPWPKRTTLESWRLVADPAFEYSQGVKPNWQDYLRLQIALIGAGYVANIDHSPVIKTGTDKNGHISKLKNSLVWKVHENMAAWANPSGLPPLWSSYTQVRPGPLRADDWGYDTVGLDGKTIYLHLLKTPYGKTGRPANGELAVGPVDAPVLKALCMNSGTEVSCVRRGGDVVLTLADVAEDPVDTIIKLELAEAVRTDRPKPVPAESETAIPPGNLAYHKKARLLSRTDGHPLTASGMSFAHYGVDGFPFTSACGAYEWAWTYQVDLGESHPLKRVVIRFGEGYATEYRVSLSADGVSWKTVAEVKDSHGGVCEHPVDSVEARYVRVEAVKPDGPDQPGIQMSIAELEVYS